MNTESARTVYCPECGVSPGDACIGGKHGQRLREHKSRRALAADGALRFAVHSPTGEFVGFLALDPRFVGGGVLGEGTFKEEGVKGGVGVAGVPHRLQDTEGPGTTSDPVETAVEAAWAKWLELRKPRRQVLADGTRKQLRRAVKAGYDVDQLERMMRALLDSDWHRDRDQLTLSTIFATKPGGKTFEDQLDTWLARAESTATSPTRGDASVTDDAVAAAKNSIRQTWGRDSKAAVQLREAATIELRRLGWTVCNSSNGQPVFSRA